VAVVGLGLMGTSLALALARCGVDLVGVEPDAGARQQVAARLPSLRMTAVPGPELVSADTVVLAVPLGALAAAARAVAPHLGADAVVTDLVSVKAPALAVLAREIGGHALVGGHPMAGRERSGPADADPDLFSGRPWAVVAPGRTPEDAVERVRALARLAGARPLDIDAAAHDRAVAATSHLPYLLSGALARAAVALAADGVRIDALVGPGLEGMLRLAGQPAWMDEVCAANREAVLEALAALEEALGDVRRALALGHPWADLGVLGDQARGARRALLAGGAPDGAGAPDKTARPSR
jgi:prephenate dehydrogenase